ncbi:uncharacterized protein LOC125811337 [Solanum verrucosum]|uniref:uncharacterized protein LOC125811337 n=1 Tax=Solanum verrucosum TaxID=315347 RepID=UPI0020D18BEE|nr:uncharacterized protein LOC125811337 [Solanum verrucosum]
MEFLEAIDDRVGFPAKFISWTMTCVTTVSYSLLLNGGLTKHFQAKRGLRQGDPVSMEYLGRELQQLTKNGNFNYHRRCTRLESVHVCFADDLLMYCRADLISVRLLNETFMKLSRASGLQVNADKISLYIAGVVDHIKQELLKELGYTEGTMPFRYLGVPLVSKKLSVN